MKENGLFDFFCQQGILLLRLSKTSTVHLKLEDNKRRERVLRGRGREHQACGVGYWRTKTTLQQRTRAAGLAAGHKEKDRASTSSNSTPQ